jgi:hypothetical protein
MDTNMEGLKLESFSIPASTVGLAKSIAGEDEPWMIEGLASTPSRDQQGEIVLVKGLDLSYLDQRKGTFNWNHFGDKDPSSVIGLITKHSRTDDGELYVKGRLLKGLPKAQAAYNLMKALTEEGETRRMGMSIEGKVLHRENKVIYKAWVKAVALTMDPVNQDTYVSFAKSFAGAEYVPQEESSLAALDPSTLERALSIATTSSGTATGGSILTPAHVESDLTDLGPLSSQKSGRRREKMSKGYTYAEAVAYIKTLVPRASDDFVDGLVRFAFSQQEHTR